MTTPLSVHPSFTKPRKPDVHDRVKALEDELRDIHNNTNEGPRLIVELVESELPKVYDLITDSDKVGELEGEVDELRRELRDAQAEVSELEDKLSEAEARIKELEDDEEEE